MIKKSKNLASTLGLGTAIGAAIFAATNEPVWLAVGAVSYTHLTLPTTLQV